MVDHHEHFALSYPTMQGKVLAGGYTMAARAIYFSHRSEEQKLRILKYITEPVQDLFFAGYFWNAPRRYRALRELPRRLDAIPESDLS